MFPQDAVNFTWACLVASMVITNFTILLYVWESTRQRQTRLFSGWVAPGSRSVQWATGDITLQMDGVPFPGYTRVEAVVPAKMRRLVGATA
jgi:hypothetical protein